MTEETHRYFKDDGKEFSRRKVGIPTKAGNPNLIPKPTLCTTCKKDDNPEYEVACNLTRADQKEDIFICFAYVPNSVNIDGNAVLKEMQDYMDRKYNKQ